MFQSIYQYDDNIRYIQYGTNIVYILYQSTKIVTWLEQYLETKFDNSVTKL